MNRTAAVPRALRLASVAAALLISLPAPAAITRIEIDSSAPFAQGRSFGEAGAYVHIRGRLHGELDPALAANRGIVDLARVPRNPRGRVEYAADFEILRPADPARGNGTLLYEVNNRGNKRLIHLFNNAPAANALTGAEAAGDGFLMRQGFTLAWSGWIPGLPAGGDLLRLEVPRARGLEQRVWDEFLFNRAGQTEAQLSFAAAHPDTTRARLSVQTGHAEPPAVIGPGGWAFVGPQTIALLPRGTAFREGALYRLVYPARDPPVTGIGLAATRDFIAFLRYRPHDAAGTDPPLAGTIRVAIAHGTSQSGRYLRDLLERGFNQSEDGRTIFNGMNPHVASARLYLDWRFAQPNRAYSLGYGFAGYPDTRFPFAYASTREPHTGRTASLLDTCRAHDSCPKIIQTVTSTEYWQGGHSLNTTDPSGRHDLALPENVRIYHFAGTQHILPATMPPGVCTGRPNRAVDPRPAMRALLVALDRWVKDGVAPPASIYPRIDDGTLVSASDLHWPAIPGFSAPREPNPMLPFDYGPRADAGIIDRVPPRAGAPRYRILVPAIDADGNERSGLRMPEQLLAAATTTGWSLRSAAGGSAGELCYLDGNEWPLAATAAERQVRGDPRPALAERFPDAASTLAKLHAAADALHAGGYLLAEDIEPVVRRAAARILAPGP